MRYPSHWRMAYAIAFFAHLAAWLFFRLAVPQFLVWMPRDETIQALEWAGDVGEDEPPPAPEETPEAAAPDDAPEPVEESLPEEPSTPIVARNEKEAIEQLKRLEKKEAPPKTILIGAGGGQQMAENARLVRSFYPAPGTVSFGGRVSVSARIGKDGRIRSTKIMVTSGRPLVDAVAMSAARRWVYKPATDRNGKPMECNAIIIIPFQRLPKE